MIRYIAIFFIVIFQVLSGQNFRSADSDFYFDIGYSRESSGEYYDSDGNNIHWHPDTTSYPGYYREYTFQYSKNSVKLNGGYRLLNNLDIFAGLDLCFYNLNEKYISDNVSKKVNRVKLNEIRFETINIGANYFIFDSINYLIASVSSKIPFESESEVAISDNNDFLSSPPAEILSGLNGGIYLKNIFLGAKTKYNYRSGEYSDRLIFSAIFGFTKIENTMLRIQSNYYHSLEELPEGKRFNIREMTTHGTFIDIGFGFWGRFSERYIASFDYNIRPYGENIWSSGSLILKFGINM